MVDLECRCLSKKWWLQLILVPKSQTSFTKMILEFKQNLSFNTFQGIFPALDATWIQGVICWAIQGHTQHFPADCNLRHKPRIHVEIEVGITEIQSLFDDVFFFFFSLSLSLSLSRRIHMAEFSNRFLTGG